MKRISVAAPVVRAAIAWPRPMATRKSMQRQASRKSSTPNAIIPTRRSLIGGGGPSGVFPDGHFPSEGALASFMAEPYKWVLTRQREYDGHFEDPNAIRRRLRR